MLIKQINVVYWYFTLNRVKILFPVAYKKWPNFVQEVHKLCNKLQLKYAWPVPENAPTVVLKHSLNGTHTLPQIVMDIFGEKEAFLLC